MTCVALLVASLIYIIYIIYLALFAGPTRPSCGATKIVTPDPHDPAVGSCGSGPGCLINIGLTYFRRSKVSDDGPVLAGAR